jgi:hypothetical protein
MRHQIDTHDIRIEALETRWRHKLTTKLSAAQRRHAAKVRK